MELMELLARMEEVLQEQLLLMIVDALVNPDTQVITAKQQSNVN